MELTEAETRVATVFAEGSPLDFSDMEPTYPLTPEIVASWGPQRRIRAEALREILLGQRLGDGPTDPRGFALVGAVIEGPLNLSDAVVSFPITLYGCHFAGGLVADSARLSRLRLARSLISGGGTEGAAVRLDGARIGGQLSLAGATLSNPAGPAMSANGIQVDRDVLLNGGFTAASGGTEGAVRLASARIGGQLSLAGATLSNPAGPAMSANGIQVDGDVLLNGGFTAAGGGTNGAVLLLGARIGGQLSLAGATLSNSAGPAMSTDGMQVDGDVWLDDQFTAQGTGKYGVVRLSQSRIGGQLSMTGATLNNSTGPALHADGMQVDGGVYLDGGFTAAGDGADGAVRLPEARIGHHLSMTGATLNNSTGPALRADGIQVDVGVHLDGGFTADGNGADGAVRLIGARVGGQLILTGAILRNPAGPALRADGIQVDASVHLDGGFTADGNGADGAVRLVGARVGRLHIDDAVVDRATSGKEGEGGRLWDIDGLAYSGIPTCGTKRWLSLIREGTVGYRPQPYQQLAAAARAAGHDREVRTSLMAQREQQASKKDGGDLGWIERVWVKFTGLTLGYGYQPWRPFVGLVGVLITSICLVFFVFPKGLAHTGSAGTTLSSTATPKQVAAVAPGSPCSKTERLLIAVDIAVPLINTGVKDTCTVTPAMGGRWIIGMAALLRLLSWALTALFVAGFTSAVRKT